MKITINPEHDLTLVMLRKALSDKLMLKLSRNATSKIKRGFLNLQKHQKNNPVIYGVNTGFGKLANLKISDKELHDLQYHLILSHATGTGKLLPDKIVKLIGLLKLQGLAFGYSGIHINTVSSILNLLNHEYYPCIPAKGSVGASGDLAPLAHFTLPLIGHGKLRKENKIISAQQALKKLNIKANHLNPKEGLALINGTEVSTALALNALFLIEQCFITAILAGLLSSIAYGLPVNPMLAQIHQARGQHGQIKIANLYLKLLEQSKYEISDLRPQAPYSLRCQPQVMGACLDQLWFAANILEREANAVTDNPLIFDNCIINGGNFHAEPVAFAADNLALVIAEMASMSERRISLLNDSHMSGLPAFLSDNPGTHSGFMNAQVTAAALVSENKTLAHPASIDSIPTSANQEDHVSMATFGARRLYEMANNSATVIAIEILCACQALDFKPAKKLAPALSTLVQLIRQQIPIYKDERVLADDIEVVKKLILEDKLTGLLSKSLLREIALKSYE